jgi:hypothetical protein
VSSGTAFVSFQCTQATVASLLTLGFQLRWRRQRHPVCRRQSTGRAEVRHPALIVMFRIAFCCAGSMTRNYTNLAIGCDGKKSCPILWCRLNRQPRI